MVSLVQAGKVRAIGLSEVTVEHLERASAIHPVAAVESELSLWSRDPLDEIVPWCRQHGAAFVAFAPLGRGYLTGAVTSAGFDSSDHRATKPRFTPEAIEANRPIVEIIRGVAERHGATPAQVAIAWVLDRGEHVIPIPGTKRVPYLEENLAATSLELTARDFAELDAAPRPVGSRY
jgi:aryl-alcohol dehydrogenase-like predicted oxidoreductase